MRLDNNNNNNKLGVCSNTRSNYHVYNACSAPHTFARSAENAENCQDNRCSNTSLYVSCCPIGFWRSKRSADSQSETTLYRLFVICVIDNYCRGHHQLRMIARVRSVQSRTVCVYQHGTRPVVRDRFTLAVGVDHGSTQSRRIQCRNKSNITYTRRI